jgi:hypothetical protein
MPVHPIRFTVKAVVLASSTNFTDVVYPPGQAARPVAHGPRRPSVSQRHGHVAIRHHQRQDADVRGHVSHAGRST